MRVFKNNIYVQHIEAKARKEKYNHCHVNNNELTRKRMKHFAADTFV